MRVRAALALMCFFWFGVESRLDPGYVAENVTASLELAVTELDRLIGVEARQRRMAGTLRAPQRVSFAAPSR